MAYERFEQRRRLPGRDDDPIGANRAAGGRHIDGFGSESDSFRGRSFEKLRSARRRGCGEAGAGADRIQGRAVLAAQAGARREPCLVFDRAGVDRRRIEAGVAPRLLLAFQPCGLLRGFGNRDRCQRFEMTPHVEPPQ